MPEDVAKHFLFPNFTTPIPRMLREILENDMAPRDKISLDGLGMIKGKSGGLSMLLNTGMEVAQHYTFLTPDPQKNRKT